MAMGGADMDAEQVAGFSGRGLGGTVTINKKVYATGLVWDTVADRGKGASQAREGARRHSGDLVCLRKPSKVQYGVGSRSVGHKSGMAPLASYLSECIEGSFVAVFELEQGYYLAAVRDDQVLAGCDRLMLDKQEAMEVFAELHYGSSWQQSIAPKDWGIDGTAANTIEEIIAGFKPKNVLEPASLKGRFLKLIIAVVVILGGILAWNQYQVYQEELAFQVEQDRRAAEIERKRKLDEANKAPAIPLPWTGKNQGILLIPACTDAILKANTDIPGWIPVSLQCADGSVQMGLRRNGGTLNWVGALLNNSATSRPIVNKTSQDTVIVSWSIPPVAKYTEDANTIDRDKVRKYLINQFEEIFQPIDLKLEDPRPIPVKTARGVTNVPAPYQGLNFSIKTRHDPRDFVKILFPIPAMVITTIKLDIGTWTWQIDGNIYQKVEPISTTPNNNNSKPVTSRP